jgi:hypothetical protein
MVTSGITILLRRRNSQMAKVPGQQVTQNYLFNTAIAGLAKVRRSAITLTK